MPEVVLATEDSSRVARTAHTHSQIMERMPAANAWSCFYTFCFLFPSIFFSFLLIFCCSKMKIFHMGFERHCSAKEFFFHGEAGC